VKLIDRIFSPYRTPKDNLAMGIKLSAFASLVLFLVSWNYLQAKKESGPIDYEVIRYYTSLAGKRTAYKIIVIYRGEEHQAELLKAEWLAAKNDNELPLLYYNALFDDVFDSRFPLGPKRAAYFMLILASLLFAYYQFLYRYNGQKRINDFYKKPPPWRR
jgi:hypothetical protein